MSNSQSEITIDLNEFGIGLGVEPKNLVHQKIYDRLKTDVTQALQEKRLRFPVTECEKKTNTERYPPSSGLVFFVDGSRGAGKTTFLRTVYSSLPAALKSAEPASKRVSLVALDYIDPTRLEGSEIILLNVLRALKKVVDERAPCLSDEANHKNFRQHFKKLAGGLSLFRNGHDQLAHHDPELFFDRGLARAEDSRSLRHNLHSAIDTACQILSADALLLAFDDADTNSRHAYPLLECIRNYLDTPRLVIVATGDMELYSLLVRERFSRQLPITKNSPEEGRITQHTRMLDHLEGQYLLKLFPLPQRYHLKTLGHLLKNEEQASYKLKFKDWKSQRTPLSVLDEIIRSGLRVRVQSDIDLFKTHLLKQPLRSILQVLQRCAPFVSKSDSAGQNNVDWNQALSDALREALRGMAQGSLYKKGIVLDDLVANYLPALTSAVFELSCEDGDVDTSAYLRPQACDEDLNNCYMALAAEVAGLCAKNPSAALTYLLAGPGSVSLWGKEKRRMAGKIDVDLLGRQFRQYMAIGRNEDALNWARRATAIFAATYPAQPKSSVVSFGVIGLNKRKPGAAEDSTVFKTITAFLKEQESDSKVLPAFAYSLLDVSSQSSRCYASIYNILGLIERLWRATSEDEVSQYLKLYPPLSISSPDWGGSIDAEVEEPDSSNNDGGSSGNANQTDPGDKNLSPNSQVKPKENVSQPEMTSTPTDEKTGGASSETSEIQIAQLPQAVIKWQKRHQSTFDNHAPSSILLGKIWARIYFSLEKSSDATRPGKRDNGRDAHEIMELSAACLINAFLVEEATYGMKVCEGKLENKNPQDSTSDFLKKMEFLKTNKKDMPLTHAIATCPLVLGLLAGETRTKVIEAVREATESGDDFGVPPYMAGKVFIAGRWQKQDEEETKKPRPRNPK